ncbi:2'-5' RNA ligase [Chlamydia abortus]|nr:2'-5' RNA ligase [Chlamydia abortus]
MASSARLFIAVPIAPPVKRTLEEWTRQLSNELPFRKWTHPLDYHITLQFLGETSPETRSQIDQALPGVAAMHPPFVLSLGKLGYFGPNRSPQILWAGVEGETAPLLSLHRSTVQAMQKLGFMPEDRPYRAHITLARKYIGSAPWPSSSLPGMLPTEDLETAWSVNEIVLYQSHSGQRPMYETLSTYPLAGNTLNDPTK